MKVCPKCVLPDTFPSITFNDEGVCNYCQRHDLVSPGHRSDLKGRYQQKFQDILKKVGKGGTYDVLVAYSGGKDSTYTLQYLVADLDLKVLALTFDHGFISSRAKENMSAVAGRLGFDHIYFLPSTRHLYPAFKLAVTEEIYPVKALERASAICNTCMYVAKSIILKTAVEMQIPIIAYGWSPGQAPVQSSVMMLTASLIEKTQEMMKGYLSGVMGEGLMPYVLEERHFQRLRQSVEDGEGFYNVHPLAFLDYNEEKVLASIEALGWQAPDDTDPNSSNCLLNSFANQVHLDRYKFHPYAMENANLVREGCLKREAALEKLEKPMDLTLLGFIRKTLNIT